VEERKIMAVPMVFQDNEHIGQGRMTWKKSLPNWIPMPQPKMLKN
jgi:Alkyl hydroperoxide reductase, large subunit